MPGHSERGVRPAGAGHPPGPRPSPAPCPVEPGPGPGSWHACPADPQALPGQFLSFSATFSSRQETPSSLLPQEQILRLVWKEPAGFAFDHRWLLSVPAENEQPFLILPAAWAAHPILFIRLLVCEEKMVFILMTREF